MSRRRGVGWHAVYDDPLYHPKYLLPLMPAAKLAALISLRKVAEIAPRTPANAPTTATTAMPKASQVCGEKRQPMATATAPAAALFRNSRMAPDTWRRSNFARRANEIG